MEVKKMEAEKTSAFLLKQKANCKLAKSPEKTKACLKKIDEQVANYQKQIIAINSKLKKLALKGKDVGTGIERARRGQGTAI
jgi:hypothetical protein